MASVYNTSFSESHLLEDPPRLVRPVLTLNEGILDNVTQLGTIDDPIIIK